MSVNRAGSHLRQFTGKTLSICKPLGAESGILTDYFIKANFTLSRVEPAKGDITRVQFTEISDRDAAAELTNYFIGVPVETLTALAAAERGAKVPALEELWYFELLGLSVIDAATERQLGIITAVEELGLNTIVTITPAANQNQVMWPLEIPLSYPHWQGLDLSRRCVMLSEWQVFSDAQ